MAKLYSNFNSRCKSYDNRIVAIIKNKSAINDWEFNYLTEVLISDIWQSWCYFTRRLVMSSCRGTRARDKSVIKARSADNSWKRLGYEAKQALRNQRATPTGHTNFLIRLEPTWGDLNNIIRIITALNPSNQNTLLSSYGSFSQLKDLQLVRNACAHKNIETINSLSPLGSRYSFSTLNCAPEVAWATVNGSKYFAIERWLYEMKMISYLATEKS